jgi:NAD(P)-dependent dehydrogenase (short-subunit alcohol dehydrogenase family)
VQANVLQEASIRAAMEAVLHEFGRVDGLINAAGGNKPAATTSDERLSSTCSRTPCAGSSTSI